MSDPVIIALIVGTPGIITAINSFYNSQKLNRLKEVTDKTSENVNGRMDQLIQRTHETSYAKGVKDTKAGMYE